MRVAFEYQIADGEKQALFIADGDNGKALYLQALFDDLLFATLEFFGVVDKQDGFVFGEVVGQFVLSFPGFEF